jgi:3-hydroxyacyl-[acyl-carrier-protein] dehydratase
MDGTAKQNTGDAIAPGNETGTTVETIDIARIMHDIPHRYPFLLIDRVVELKRDDSAVGIKNVSINEAFFQGHFPGHPVMPGVLIVESMAQTAAVLVVETEGDEAGKLVYLMSIDGVRFRRPVVPGDQLRVVVKKERRRANVWKFSCLAQVDGQTVAEATLSAMIRGRAQG